jgi:hypothetical protein
MVGLLVVGGGLYDEVEVDVAVALPPIPLDFAPTAGLAPVLIALISGCPIGV